MSEARFKNEQGETRKVTLKDLVVEVLAADGVSSTVVYVEHGEGDAPPKVKFERAIASESIKENTANVPETHIIVSTESGAGNGQVEKFYEEAVKPVLEVVFPTAHSSFHTHHTESASSILDLTDKIFFPKANSGVPLRIILLSGDGGIIDLVNGLASKPASPTYKAPEVVLLPLGTANALYHSINAGKDNTWGLRSLTPEPHSKPLPIFTASFSPGARLLVNEARSEEELPRDPETGHPTLHGAVVCSWGMHASLVADSDTAEFRKFGVERFKMAAMEALYPADGSLPHPYKATVSILKGGEWTPLEAHEHMYVLASMVSNLEKTFTISPATKSLDGSLHLVRFGPAHGDEVMRIMGLAYQGGKHVDDGAVLYEEIEGLRIEMGGREEDARWRRICVDGKIVRLEGEGWVEVRLEKRRVMDVVCS